MIFGMGRNDAGTIRVLDFDHIRDEVAVKRRAAYVSPDLNFTCLGQSYAETVRFVRGFYPIQDDAYCAQLMEAFGPAWADGDRIATLSFGAKT